MKRISTSIALATFSIRSSGPWSAPSVSLFPRSNQPLHPFPTNDQVGESYNRAYKVLVKVQQLAEMEEVIEYKQTDAEDRKLMIRKIWTQRLKGCQRNVEVWRVRCALPSP